MFPKLKTVYTDMLCEDEIYRFKNLEYIVQMIIFTINLKGVMS